MTIQFSVDQETRKQIKEFLDEVIPVCELYTKCVKIVFDFEPLQEQTIIDGCVGHYVMKGEFPNPMYHYPMYQDGIPKEKLPEHIKQMMARGSNNSMLRLEQERVAKGLQSIVSREYTDFETEMERTRNALLKLFDIE